MTKKSYQYSKLKWNKDIFHHRNLSTVHHKDRIHT